MEFMRKKKSHWYLFRYRGDMAVYCYCMNCGWTTSVSAFKNGTFEVIIDHIPRYCQECGRKNRLHNGYVAYLHDPYDGKLIPNKERVYHKKENE